MQCNSMENSDPAINQTNLTAEMQEKFERICRLEQQGISVEQIALALGMSANEIQLAKESDEFKQLAQGIVSEIIEEQTLINSGWDGVEQAALATVISHLQHRKDPDYALRAATLANKATRRNSGQEKHDATLAMRAGARVVINLNTQFISGIAQLQTTNREQRMLTVSEKKAVDMMATAAVDELMSGPIEIDQEALQRMVSGSR